MRKYEKPEIKFKELSLCESIADRCWAEGTKNGDGNVYYNFGGQYGQVKLQLNSAGSCGHSTVAYVEANGQKYYDDGDAGNGDLFELVQNAFNNASGEPTNADGFSDNGSK